ncbi:MAG TPA: hypothetical protein VLM39_03675, partial [Ignavibacteriaceae bacterium]|nr:hypothetical protein [Ignavibacteriaceae bacterium]
GWADGNIELKLNERASSGDITGYISSMPKTRGTSEVFFFSGHRDNGDGLITYETDGNITPGNLQDAFGSTYRQFCCILNACHSGTFVNGMSRGEILTACSSAEVAITLSPNGRNCNFTYINIHSHQTIPIRLIHQPQ